MVAVPAVFGADVERAAVRTEVQRGVVVGEWVRRRVHPPVGLELEEVHRGVRVVDAGVLALEPGVEPLELDGVVEALAVIPGSDDDLVATRRPLLRVHGTERWTVGPCVLEDRVLVERAGTVGGLPSAPQQRRDLVLDDLGAARGRSTGPASRRGHRPWVRRRGPRSLIALPAASLTAPFFGPERLALGNDPKRPRIWLGMPPEKYPS